LNSSTPFNTFQRPKNSRPALRRKTLPPVKGWGVAPVNAHSWARHHRRIAPTSALSTDVVPAHRSTQPANTLATLSASAFRSPPFLLVVQPGGVPSSGLRNTPRLFWRATWRTRCERLPDAFSQGLVSYPKIHFLVVQIRL
jgi:hypothetical protein